MLVLTRRSRERICFPDFDTTVEVMAIKSGSVRLGIKAPPAVTVLREEVAARAETQAPAARPPPNAAEPTLRQLNHLLRNWLDVAAVGLALLHRQPGANGAAAALDPLDGEVGALREHMQGMGRRPLPQSRVLLVDADGPRRETLAGSLRLAGLVVATAGDGRAALDHLASRGRTDVLLLDMRLPPPCDGPALVRAVRGDPDHAGVRIFGVSRHGPERFCLAGGVDHWFNTSHAAAGVADLNKELADVD